MRSLYLASPLGFTEIGRAALPGFVEALSSVGWEVRDPWQLNADLPERELELAEFSGFVRDKKVAELVDLVGRRNEQAIDECDLVVAILAGVDVDSGVAAEIGYAYAKGKTVFGYRGDFRDVGDLPGAEVNIQVLRFIRASGGRVVRTLEELTETLVEINR